MKDDFLKVAKQAALEAGKVILKYYGKKNERTVKGDISNFSTKADLEAEKVIIRIITDHFPDHNLISEEAGKINKGSKYTWVVDPLDGTITFAAGLPFFTVSIGLLKQGTPILGVVNQPTENKIYWAESNKGAYLNNKRIHVSKNNDLEKAVVGIDFGHRDRRQHKFDVYIKPWMYKVSYLVSMGPNSFLLALVAQGLLDAMASDAWVWDHLAGVVLVTEAGGEVTNSSGRQIDWTKDRVDTVASNGLIHNQILEVLSASLRGTK